MPGWRKSTSCTAVTTDCWGTSKRSSIIWWGGGAIYSTSATTCCFTTEGRLVDRRNAVLRRPARNDLVIGNRMTGEIGVRPLASPLLRTIARNRRQSQHPQDEREAR